MPSSNDSTKNAPLTLKQVLDKIFKGESLAFANLSGAYLSGAYLGDANLGNANLSGAYLGDANLRDANLRGAYLGGAYLGGATVLPTGETWRDYLTDVLPHLLAVGGIAAEIVLRAWDCHYWENCPMAVAFSVTSLMQIPALFRPRAEQFVQFFDAGLIKADVVNGTLVFSAAVTEPSAASQTVAKIDEAPQ